MNVRVVLPFLFVVLILVSCRQEQPAGELAEGAPPAEAGEAGDPLLGRDLSDFEAQTLDGGTFRLSEMEGKAVLVNLWATWCPPCRHEIPDLVAIQRERGGEDFTVLGVTIDDASAVDDVRAMMGEYAINYPVVHDPKGIMGTRLRTTVIPTSALLDREGKVVWYRRGVVTENDPELLQALEKLESASAG